MENYIWIVVVLFVALGVPMLERFERSKVLRRMYYGALAAYLAAQIWEHLPRVLPAAADFITMMATLQSFVEH